MPHPTLSTDAVEFILETRLMVEGAYQCDLLNDEITAAIQALNDAGASSTSALGHSVTIDKDQLRANLDQLLAARNLCKRRAAAITEGSSAEDAAALPPPDRPMATSFDFSKRSMR